jgi:hypothetical protein
MSDGPEFAPPSAFPEPVVIYTTRWCGYCMMALRLLRARAFAFVQVPVGGSAVPARGSSARPVAPSPGLVGGRSVGG